MRAIVLAVGFLLAAVSPAAASSARVWVTTPDGAEKMHDRGTVAFHPGGSERADDHASTRAARYQTMDGFGASITDSSRARALPARPGRARRRRCASLFARRDGLVVPAPADGRLGLRRRAALHLRRRAGRADRLRACGTSRSRTTARRSCRCCARRWRSTRELKVIGTPWSPPAWMKTNGSLVGGRLIDDPRDLRRLRALLRQVRAGLPARRRADLRPDACRTSRRTATRARYPGMDMPVAQEAKLIDALGPTLRRARACDTKILGYDHNWSEHPNDVANTPPGEDPETEYPTDLLDSRAGALARRHRVPLLRRRPEPPDRAAQRVPATRASGSPSAPARTARPTRRRRSSPTRSSGTRATSSSASPATGRKTVVNWNLALDPTGGPHNGGCDTCTGVRHRRPGRHASPATPSTSRSGTSRASCGPARVRIASTSFGTTGWNGQIMDVAFRNPRRLDRARRAQRERRPAHVRRRAGRLVVRLHAARRRARHVHLADGARSTTATGCSIRRAAPTEAVDDDATTRWTRRATLEPRPRPHAARAPRRARHRRRPATPGAATRSRSAASTGRAARRGGPAHDLRHPGDAGAVPAGRHRDRARDGRGRAYLPLRRKFMSSTSDPAVDRGGARRRARRPPRPRPPRLRGPAACRSPSGSPTCSRA